LASALTVMFAILAVLLLLGIPTRSHFPYSERRIHSPVLRRGMAPGTAYAGDHDPPALHWLRNYYAAGA